MTSFEPSQLQALYEQGENIHQWLKKNAADTLSTEQAIDLSYDLQTGSYIQLQDEAHIVAHYEPYTEKLANLITSLCPNAHSLLEAGAGEATTLCRTLKHLNYDKTAFALDLSWSRMAYGKRWLAEHGFTDVQCVTGDMFRLPFADASIDVVYTSHAVEPNGGREEAILRELVRVARSHVIMLEPSFELAEPAAQARMKEHGFCRDLAGTAKRCGFKVLTHELYPYRVNRLNPTALTIIEKGLLPNEAKEDDQAKPFLACPQYRTPLEKLDGFMFSPRSFMAYPIMANIACLRPENAIVASRYPEFAKR